MPRSFMSAFDWTTGGRQLSDQGVVVLGHGARPVLKPLTPLDHSSSRSLVIMNLPIFLSPAYLLVT
jgi:hypothetical protein